MATAPTQGHSDWTGLMHNNGHDDVRGAHGTMMDGPMVSGTGPNNFVDFEFDSGIWESIMNTLSQPLDLGA